MKALRTLLLLLLFLTAIAVYYHHDFVLRESLRNQVLLPDAVREQPVLLDFSDISTPLNLQLNTTSEDDSPLNYGLYEVPQIESEKNRKLLPDRLRPELTFEDQTGAIRKTAVKAELGVAISETGILGIGVSKEIYDRNDAKAWKADVESKENVEVSYKVSF